EPPGSMVLQGSLDGGPTSHREPARPCAPGFDLLPREQAAVLAIHQAAARIARSSGEGCCSAKSSLIWCVLVRSCSAPSGSDLANVNASGTQDGPGDWRLGHRRRS